MCFIKCCMWCLEKIVAFINRNAYILIAIKGKGYCCAAADAIVLIVSVSKDLAAAEHGSQVVPSVTELNGVRVPV